MKAARLGLNSQQRRTLGVDSLQDQARRNILGFDLIAKFRRQGKALLPVAIPVMATSN
jgi:hypothetical protein